VIRLYGIVEGLEDPPAGLERRQIEGLELVLGHEDAPSAGEVSREQVLRHADVVDELMSRSAAVLPAQLGHAFRDEDELAAAVREQAPQLARTLERVRGCVEFGLRVSGLGGKPPAESESGAGYMHARLEHLRRQDAAITRLHEPLARLARAETLQRRPDGFGAAYLVERAKTSEFEAAAARVEREPGAVVVCTGPWPPYSFTGAAS
jgi:gas vesicle protein GvpL/GvpF